MTPCCFPIEYPKGSLPKSHARFLVGAGAKNGRSPLFQVGGNGQKTWLQPQVLGGAYCKRLLVLETHRAQRILLGVLSTNISLLDNSRSISSFPSHNFQTLGNEVRSTVIAAAHALYTARSMFDDLFLLVLSYPFISLALVTSLSRVNPTQVVPISTLLVEYQHEEQRRGYGNPSRG